MRIDSKPYWQELISLEIRDVFLNGFLLFYLLESLSHKKKSININFDDE